MNIFSAIDCDSQTGTRAPRCDETHEQSSCADDFYVRRDLAIGRDVNICGDIVMQGKICADGGFSVGGTKLSSDLEVPGSVIVSGDVQFGVARDQHVRSAPTTTTVGGRLIVAGPMLAQDCVQLDSDLFVNGCTKLSHSGVALHVAGAAEKTVGGTTWINASDKRVKKNIRNADVQDCLDLIMKLSLKKFGYADDWCLAQGIEQSREYGLIAQDLEKVLPASVMTESVRILKDPETGKTIRKFKNFKNVSFDQIYKILIGAVQQLYFLCQEQQKQIDDLQAT